MEEEDLEASLEKYDLEREKKNFCFVLVRNDNLKRNKPRSSPSNESDEIVKHRKFVECFERNLLAEKLFVERRMEIVNNKSKEFVLIGISEELLEDYAEKLEIKLPIQSEEEKQESVIARALYRFDPFMSPNLLAPMWQKLANWSVESATAKFYHKKEHYIDARYQKVRRKVFQKFASSELIKLSNPDSVFSNSVRIRVIQYILKHTAYGKNTEVGIDRLLAEEVYEDAYPLHEADEEVKSKTDEIKESNLRTILRETWASWAKSFYFQPLFLVKRYFGPQIGIYFTWLGWYTQMLILPSALGLLVTFRQLMGFAVFDWINDSPVQRAMCNDTRIMCPPCDGPARSCRFTVLDDSCASAKISAAFDNKWTVIYALFMATWAKIFCHLWTRKEAKMTNDWNLTEDSIDSVRVQFENRAKKMQERRGNILNTILQKLYPVKEEEGSYKVSYVRKLPYLFVSVSIILTLCLIAIFGVLTVQLYRLWMASFLTGLDWNDHITENSVLIASASSVCLSMVFIYSLDWVFRLVASWLTELEMPKLDTAYEKSYTLKVFMFNAVNFWGSIFYIAFIKGHGTGTPLRYSRWQGLSSDSYYRLEECHPAGCLMDVSLQLGIILMIKQVVSNFVELAWPWWNARKQKKINRGSDEKPWVRDYLLAKNENLCLLNEYQEMAIQFGFITIFVATFPLAPFFALMNNVIEIRLDAYKFIKLHRRARFVMARSIGAWVGILRTVSSIAVLTNALVAGYTSDIVPRVVYSLMYAQNCEHISPLLRPMKNECYKGYVDWSTQSVHISELDYGHRESRSGEDHSIWTMKDKWDHRPNNDFFKQVLADRQDFSVIKNCLNSPIATSEDARCKCYYRGFDTEPFYIVLSARLMFILIFEHIVQFMKWTVLRMLPNQTEKLLKENLKKERLRQQKFHELDNNANHGMTTLDCDESKEDESTLLVNLKES